MKFQFEIATRVRTVEVLRQPQGYQVIVDGRPRLVEAVRVGPDAWSLIVRGQDGLGARSLEATVLPVPGNGSLDVHLDGYRIPVLLRNGLRRRAGGAGGTGGRGLDPAVRQRMTAPMPGRVTRVLVSVGDEVKTRQGLVVVEAMKMENELRATRDGRVRDVFVSEGQLVEAGTALVVVE